MEAKCNFHSCSLGIQFLHRHVQHIWEGSNTFIYFKTKSLEGTELNCFLFIANLKTVLTMNNYISAVLATV